MTFRLNTVAVLGLMSLLASPSLRAQEKGKRPWHVQTDVGFVNTAGNTSTTTLNAGEKASYQTGAWTFGQQFSVVYGRTDGQRSAESYMAQLRGDNAFSKRVGLYVSVAWDRNPFAGISRRFEEGAGLVFKAVATDRTTLSVEAGFAQTQKRDLAGVTDNYAGGRGAVVFKQMLNDKAFIQQLGEVLPNFKESRDVRINTETSLVAPLSARIAFKAGYVIRFDNAPEPGFAKTDRFLTSGLQIVF